METILQTIADYARTRVRMDREETSLDVLKELCRQGGPANGKAFEDALKKPGIRFICEIKRASPSKGILAQEFPYLDMARAYEAAGADCISCLTEPKWFLGSDEIFREIRSEVSIPMLRKDFVVDEYQIYQAKCMGANAVLLICALLETETVARYLKLCARLGLAALVEAHDEQEISNAVAAGARIIGVNNRNLKDFSVDIGNSGRLRALVPDEILFVAESGIQTPEDIRALRQERVDAVLIGEALVRAPDKKAMLDRLRSTQ
ncbi:MAG: indole-3-glycerol phosphate synthase TrpC [Lawsonibacter sp.]